jgi:hypothetical protein
MTVMRRRKKLFEPAMIYDTGLPHMETSYGAKPIWCTLLKIHEPTHPLEIAAETKFALARGMLDDRLMGGTQSALSVTYWKTLQHHLCLR